MGSAGQASWMVAASVTAVEALKDQVGLCRWNYAIRSLHQQTKSNLRSFSQGARRSSGAINQEARRCNADDNLERLKRREAEKVEKVLQLVCWGPN